MLQWSGGDGTDDNSLKHWYFFTTVGHTKQMYYFKITIRVKEHNSIYLSKIQIDILYWNWRFYQNKSIIYLQTSMWGKSNPENRWAWLWPLPWLSFVALTVFRCPDRLPLPWLSFVALTVFRCPDCLSLPWLSFVALIVFRCPDCLSLPWLSFVARTVFRWGLIKDSRQSSYSISCLALHPDCHIRWR